MSAFDATVDLVRPSVGDVPVNQLNWVIATQRGGFSTLHQDASGLCTLVRCVCGEKEWVIKRRKNYGDLRDARLLGVGDWDSILVPIRPGDIL